jgi:hypothetical protein
MGKSMKNSSQACFPQLLLLLHSHARYHDDSRWFAGILTVPASGDHVDLGCWAGLKDWGVSGARLHVMTGLDTAKERSCLKVQRHSEGLVGRWVVIRDSRSGVT